MEKKNDVELNIFRRIAKIFFRILYNLLTIICIILICIIVMQKITDNNGSIGGYRIFRVVSGSMIPRYNIGEVVICKETSGDDIELGDAIVYRGKVADLKGKLIMHEVIAKTYDEEGKLKITAKGLLNGTEDPDVTEEEVLGVVKFSSGILTFLYVLATGTYSSFIIIFILAVNVFISFRPSKEEIEKKYKTKRLDIDEEDDELEENLEENIEENYEEDSENTENDEHKDNEGQDKIE